MHDAPPGDERRRGVTSRGLVGDYPPGMRRRRDALIAATLRSTAARTVPGAGSRISDTLVRPVEATWKVDTALSVVHDNAERPVQDRGTPASAMQWRGSSIFMI